MEARRRSGVTLTDRFDRSFVFARDLHRTQRRKTSGAPYLSHLLGVCSLVIEDGGSEDEAIAALLHDAPEDRNAPLEEIRNRFGDEVARLVAALTERPSAGTKAAAGKSQRWRAHKQIYIDRIPFWDLPVRRISCADTLHNVRSLISGYRALGGELWNRFMTRDPADHLWAYDAIARAFTQAGGTGLAPELEDAVEQFHSLMAVERGGVAHFTQS